MFSFNTARHNSTENYIPGSVKCNRLFKYPVYGVPFLKTNKLFLFLKKIIFLNHRGYRDIKVHKLSTTLRKNHADLNV